MIHRPPTVPGSARKPTLRTTPARGAKLRAYETGIRVPRPLEAMDEAELRTELDAVFAEYLDARLEVACLIVRHERRRAAAGPPPETQHERDVRIARRYVLPESDVPRLLALGAALA